MTPADRLPSVAVLKGGVFVRVHMDPRYTDAFKVSKGGKPFTPAIVWNPLMLEKFDDSKYDYSKVKF